MKKILPVLLVVVLTLTLFAACGGESGASTETSPASDLVENEEVVFPDHIPLEYEKPAEDNQVTVEDLITKGEFVVGLDDTFAPMGFRDEAGELVGFDIDLAKAVGAKLGLNVRFQSIAWDAKEMELASGRIDCIWNGLSVTPERQANMSLSNAYLANNIVVMLKDGVTIATKEELANYNIGIQAGSSALEAVKNDEVYALVQDKITEYPTYDEVILDMQAGRLDCMVIDQVFGDYKNSKLSAPFATAEFNFGEDIYAVGFRKDDAQLTEAVNQAIAELVADGTAVAISETWFGANRVLTA